MFTLITKYLGYGLIFLLILSFAFWGVGDVFRGGSSQAVAMVGDAEITRSQLQREFNRQVAQLRQFFGAALTPEMAQKMGIEQRVLQQLVNDQLLANAGEALGYRVGHDEVVKFVATQSSFQNADGKFEPDLFTQFLRQEGFTEAQFVQYLSNRLSADMVVDQFSAFPAVPTKAADILAAAALERRNASVLSIGADAVKIASPSAEALAEFYDTQKRQFAIPATRTVQIASFGTKQVARSAAVTDAQIQAAYEARKDEFVTPESRSLEQIFVTKEEKAKTLAERLQKGESFAALVSELKQDPATTAFGSFTESELAAQGLLKPDAVAALFALKQGEHSAPIRSSLGWHIFSVTTISAPAAISMDKATTQLRQELEQENIQNALYSLIAEVEDAVSGGETLAAVSKRLSLELKTATLTEGDANAAKNPALPTFGEPVKLAFETAVGEHSAVTSSAEGTEYFVLFVEAETPQKEQPLEAVKAKVTEAWKKEEQARQLQIFAEKEAAAIASLPIAKRAAAFDTLVRTHALKVKKLAGVEKQNTPEGAAVSDAVRQAIFALKSSGDVSPVVQDENALVLVKLESVTQYDPVKQKEARAAFTREITEGSAQEMVMQYLNTLQLRDKVEIFYRPATTDTATEE